MPAQQGTIRVRQQEQTLRIQLEGWARMAQALAVRRLAEQHLAAGSTTLRVDLRRCTYMDSTFIGILLFLKRAVDRAQGSFALVSPSVECRRLLQQMMLDKIFPMVTEDEAASNNWTILCASPDDNVDAFQCNVVQAHQELANLPGPASKPFKETARLLKQDLEAKNKQ